MTDSNPNIDVLMHEQRKFVPSFEFRSAAYIASSALHEHADRNSLNFWQEQTKYIDWMTPSTQVLDASEAPFYRWFKGGVLNVSANCLDRHVQSGHGNKAAIIWEGEPGDRRTFTYRELWRYVNKFANALKKLGVVKGGSSCDLSADDSRGSGSDAGVCSHRCDP